MCIGIGISVSVKLDYLYRNISNSNTIRLILKKTYIRAFIRKPALEVWLIPGFPLILFISFTLDYNTAR